MAFHRRLGFRLEAGSSRHAATMTGHAAGAGVKASRTWMVARRRNVESVFLYARRHGWWHTLHHVLLRTINSVALFKILRGVRVERADPAFSTCPEPYTAQFLPERMLRDFARDPDNQMPEGFLEEALSKGDKCFGICHGATLAAYSWYATTPTRIDPPGLQLRFGAEYVYMYKGFTQLAYRGKRLYAIGMTMALQHFLSRGSKGLVCYIESDNFDSLKSSFRMGYAAFGSVFVMRILGRYLAYATPGCGRYGFRVHPTPPS